MNFKLLNLKFLKMPEIKKIDTKQSNDFRKSEQKIVKKWVRRFYEANISHGVLYQLNPKFENGSIQ